VRSDAPRYEVAPLKWQGDGNGGSEAVSFDGTIYLVEPDGNEGPGFLLKEIEPEVADRSIAKHVIGHVFGSEEEAMQEAFDRHARNLNRWLMPVYGEA